MEKQINIKLTELFNALNEKIIAYNSIYSKITGSITAGVLLSQILYWYKKMNNKEFYKTDASFCEELGMGLYELKGAKKKLVELEIITITRKGVPAKSYYEVNINRIITLITSYGKNPQLVMGKTHNKSEEKPTTITENTTENNTKITYKEKENIKEKEKPINYNLKDKELADYIFTETKKRYPFTKDNTEKQMEKEYEEMNRLHRLDGFEYDVIKAVAVFSQEDNFWQQNIRSVSKFRIKFEELLIKAQAEIKRREKYKIIEI